MDDYLPNEHDETVLQNRLLKALEAATTSFDTTIGDITQNRLDIPATYNANTERLRLLVNGTDDREFGSSQFTDRPGKYQLTAEPGDTLTFGAREPSRYVPSYEFLWGAAAWYDSAPTENHRLVVEFADDPRENVYGVEFTPGSTRLFQRSGGSLVDEQRKSEWEIDPFALGSLDRTQPWITRCFLNWYGAGNARYDLSHTRVDGTQVNPQVGQLANREDIATEEVNLRLQVTVEHLGNSGDDPFTINIGSFGAVVRGNATQIDRVKTFTKWGLGGSLSQSFADNDPLIALRVDPTRANVVTQVLPPSYVAGGGNDIEVLLGAVPAGATDATGFSTPLQHQRDNSAIEATENVTTVPTDGAGAPDVRYLTGGVSLGGSRNNPGSVSGDVTNGDVKRALFPDEVGLVLARTDPTSIQTDGSITYIRVGTEQDY
jgi:hypothetical protein